MAVIHDLLSKIEDADLRDRLAKEVEKLTKRKKFGLVYEEHIPECTPLYDIPIKIGANVAMKTGYVNDIYTAIEINGDTVLCRHKETHEQKTFSKDEVVVVAEFGEPIYPYLKPIDSICNAPESDLWHTLIEADNYHALQLLEYLYAGKVDCIYIDPPYNTGAKDWKYNNDYVDRYDSYSHSKWLSMMEKRLKIAKKLLNPNDSVLIVTIDEKEYLHLGCLLEMMFSGAQIQMISSVINLKGVARGAEFFRVNEYLFIIRLGKCQVATLPLPIEWKGNIKRSTIDKVRWGSLMRSGSNSERSHSQGCFYPIFISKDKKHFCGAGTPIPLGIDKNSVNVPQGQIAIFPIHDDGTEGVWQYSRERFLEIQRKGYVRISTQTKKQATFMYISEGWQNKVEKGQIKVIGKAEDGSLILDDSDYIQEYVPCNQWWIPSHDATQYGTNFLNDIIVGRHFPFPKSVYAVHDIIRFFTVNKPNSLIVDFFAGSGTTLHAINLLNAEDGGHRRCIMVTNNEVSDDEAKKLKAQGYKSGDEEWEKLGIARYVTWPRTVCSIEGHNINGEPLEGDYGVSNEVYESDDEVQVVSAKTGKPIKKTVYRKVKIQSYPKLAEINKSEGFKTNAIYFKLSFLDKMSVALGRQFKELLPILWMKAGAIGKCPSLEKDELPNMLVLPENDFAVLIDEKEYLQFLEEMAKHPAIKTIYFVTDSESAYKSMARDFSGAITYQLYRDYLDNFRINVRR